ncbi:MAG: HepT-like ribonuclease domain-containing protein, partial [Planctomycetota bacterium]
VHAYFGILPDVVWDIIKNELAPLKEKITQLLADSDI